MKIQVTLQSTRIKITEPQIADTYYIVQADDNKRFYISSDNGYNGYDGFDDFEKAFKKVKHFIKNYFVARCEENPKGW